MRVPRIVGAVWLVAGLLPLGCNAWPLLSQATRSPDRTLVSPPGEDGTRYIMVEGGRFTSPKTLKRRWAATVHQTCDGESQELSQSAYARRESGVVRSRIHDGYVRCLLPDGSEPGASPNAPTVAEATAESKPAEPTPRRRRPLRSRIFGRR